MGVSTDGQLSYGIVFEDDYEFPWSDEDEGDIEDWWINESGWKWDGDQPFTPDGDYAPGFSERDPRIAYFKSRRDWLESHPLPVELINYQSSEYPAYLLCVPKSARTARRGFPVEIDLRTLEVTDAEETALLEFCSKYELEIGDGPGWYLSSYCG